MLSKIHTFSFKKMLLKMLFMKWRRFISASMCSHGMKIIKQPTSGWRSTCHAQASNDRLVFLVISWEFLCLQAQSNGTVWCGSLRWDIFAYNTPIEELGSYDEAFSFRGLSHGSLNVVTTPDIHSTLKVINSLIFLITYYGLVMPYGNIDLGHHWPR